MDDATTDSREQRLNEVLFERQAGPPLPEAPVAAPTVPGVELPPELAGHARYRVCRLLGRGGMGAVYQAEHALMERPVALKVLRPGLLPDPDAVARFRQEVRAAARLHHPNLVAALDADQAGPVTFLVMEYVEGQSLAERVATRGPLPAAEACEYARQAALGLQHAHERGMVHRDVKPANLMLTRQGQVKVLDFGLARLLREQAPAGVESTVLRAAEGQAAALTGPGVVMGTLDYVAPEQARDSRGADARADIYSLGCTLYFLLTGQVPFPAPNAAEKLARLLSEDPAALADLRPDLPAGLAGVVVRMMAKRPEHRYQTAREAADALAPFSAPSGPPRRRRRPLLAVAAVAAVLAAGAGLALTQRGPREVEGAPAPGPGVELPAPPPPAPEAKPQPPAPEAKPTPQPSPPAEPPKPLNDRWQVVAKMGSPRLKPGFLIRDFRAVALRPPYVYAINASTFVSGDLVVFRLPAAQPRPGAALLDIEDCAVVENAGDGGDLCVIGETLLCTHRGGLNVFSLKDPARPTLVKRVGPAPLPRLSNVLIRHGRLACLVGGTGNVQPASHLSVFDLTKPAEPRHLSLSRIEPRAWCGCGVGKHLYLGSYKEWPHDRNGVAVIDLTDPEMPREAGFVETDRPFHVFAAGGGRRLVAVSDGEVQQLSLADPVRPALLGGPCRIKEGHGLGGRGATLVEARGHSRLVCLHQVFAVEEKGLREVFRFPSWNVGSAIPHHGRRQGGYVVIPTQSFVYVLWCDALRGEGERG
jgi:hypothetical protein